MGVSLLGRASDAPGTAALPSILAQILAEAPPAFTDADVAGHLCKATRAALGGGCELLRRDRDGVVRRLCRKAAEGEQGAADAPVPDALAALLADSGIAAEPVLLVEPPWNGEAAAVPVVGLAGVRWLLVVDGIPSLREPAGRERLQEVAWAARHVLSLGGAVAQLGRSRSAADAAAHRLIAVSRLVDLLPVSLGLDSTNAAILQALVPYVGDWAMLFLERSPGRLERAGVAHTHDEGERTLRELAHFPLPPEAARREEWLTGTDAFRIGTTAEDRPWPIAAEDEDAVRRLGPICAAVAPMRRGSDLVGVLVVGTSHSGQRYERDELRLVRDVAKQARLAIQAAQLFAKAERARREREEVLAIVSHDLRNPLQTVRLAGAALGFPDLPEEKRAQQSAVLEHAIDSMDRLIQDLLDAARIESGRFAVATRLCAVSGLLADAYRSFELISGERNVALRLEPGAPVVRVLADRDAVLRVFGNLLGNAISFTPAGGRITVSAELAEEGVAFLVRDGGPGIDPQVLPHIFERYWQANRAARTGAGLGLAIAKGIVEAHGGTISARTRPEGGSEFRFTLRTPAEGETQLSTAPPDQFS